MNFWYLITLGGRALIDCCQSNWLAIAVVILCACNLVGYLVIARHWQKQHDDCRDPIAAAPLIQLRNIFILCGIVSYGFMVIKIWIPLWLPYLVAMFVLNCWTWKYASRVSNFRVMYEPLDHIHEISRLLNDSHLADHMRLQLMREAIDRYEQRTETD